MTRRTDRRPDVRSPGVRDAAEILARVLEDEREAVATRERLHRDGLSRLAVDGHVKAQLVDGEDVVAARGSIVVTRHCPGEPDEAIAGPLYLTTRHLIVGGRGSLSIALDEIDELAVVGERLLITLADHSGLSVDTSRPRLLRVEVAAAVAASRA